MKSSSEEKERAWAQWRSTQASAMHGQEECVAWQAQGAALGSSLAWASHAAPCPALQATRPAQWWAAPPVMRPTSLPPQAKVAGVSSRQATCCSRVQLAAMPLMVSRTPSSSPWGVFGGRRRWRRQGPICAGHAAVSSAQGGSLAGRARCGLGWHGAPGSATLLPRLPSRCCSKAPVAAASRRLRCRPRNPTTPQRSDTLTARSPQVAQPAERATRPTLTSPSQV